jgi:hypothetical protein
MEKEMTRKDAEGAARNLTRDIENWLQEELQNYSDTLAWVEKQVSKEELCTFGVSPVRFAAMITWWRTRAKLGDW